MNVGDELVCIGVGTRRNRTVGRVYKITTIKVYDGDLRIYVSNNFCNTKGTWFSSHRSLRVKFKRLDEYSVKEQMVIKLSGRLPKDEI